MASAELQAILPAYHEFAADIDRRMQDAELSLHRRAADSADRLHSTATMGVNPQVELENRTAHNRDHLHSTARTGADQRYRVLPTWRRPPEPPPVQHGPPMFFSAISHSAKRTNWQANVRNTAGEKDSLGIPEALTSALLTLTQAVTALRPQQPAAPLAPTLSKFTDDYLAERGETISKERAGDQIRPIVRDLIAAVGDKPVTAYDGEDCNHVGR